MKDRSYFLRKDLETYKKKFLLLCNQCEFKIIKYEQNKKEIKS